ncbi:Type I restriction-modification system, specificity subunit S [Halomonas citrativorans]|uniref:Type I restriction-modification system, specificity subunit S n=1 Tax=Halomonas citrativorans TaxID=2742612 RepID=A0A1R4HN06_9GAMM|nr:restriction endonuclease subunit S [Halomonas citrativorans]SJN08921.1 Type I restriction-modification system, specificity subunit S [Halomonas citrativorans]
MVPEGWKKAPVGTICQSIVPGRNKPKSFDGDIPWVTTPEISGRYIPSYLQKNYVTKSALAECGGKIVPSGAVIMAAVGELGLVAISTEDVVLNQQLHAFVCSDSVQNEYLAYALSAQKYYMESVASKTTIPYLNKANCESIPVPLPPLPEQKKIAQILSTWDQAITATERLLENSQQRKKGLMQQLMTGKKRLPGFEGEWEEVPLSELADYVKGYTYKSDEYSEIPTSTGFLTLKSLLRGGGYSKGGLKYLTTEIEDKFLVKEGDIVFAVTDITRGAEIVGAPLLVPNLRLPQVAISMDMVKLLVKPSVAPKFLYFALKRSTARNFMRSRASGSTVLHLDVKGSKKLRLPIPRDANEQEAISDVMTIADQEIEAIAQRLILLKEEKKALMQQLLTGKRRGKVDTEAA